ncbi:tripartite motif-containing protein 14 isoform X2 [Cygnus olor]|uniref:tripartite motif-containing protein 14 isoform X2 n=1 Tax=Cygnus olor TaxID=8869 RepID=UPI001ADE4012|nr:tripartite motif-containing protein 14 isoform X2 [Cygnus olor]
MAQGEPCGAAAAWRCCGAHSGRPLELLCEECGRCVCALCPALGPHRGHRACLLPHAARHRQELLTLYLKDLEERKEQEAGNRRCIEQAANDLKKSIEIEKEMQEPKSQLEQWHPIPLSFEHVLNYYKHLMTVLQSVLQKPLEARLKEDVFSSLNATTKKEPGTMLKTMSPVDRLLFLKHARTPTWEYDSLHPRLKLSDDRLVVSCNWRRMFYPCGPQRFDKLWQVLSRDAFLSGSHYWEVDLLQAGTGWWIGAAYPSIGRKGDSETCRLGWNRASWCIKRFDFEYWAFHKGERIPLAIEDDPDRIGVFLDYEAGILSFYNVTDGMAHLHTFRCKFTEPIYPALRLWEGSIGIRKLT